MSILNLNKERYTRIQIIILISSIMVYVFLNRKNLATYDGWLYFVIYVVFNVAIMLSGQRVGSIKDLIGQMQKILYSEGNAESKLSETEYNLKAAAAQCGIAWEQYNREAKKIFKKKEGGETK